MNKEDLESIIEDKSPEIKKKAILLFNGEVLCSQAYQKDPSAANLKNWQLAETALVDFVSQVKSASAERPAFSNKYAVYMSIKEDGLKVSKSKLYKDADKGLLRVQPDGSVFLSDVELYKRAYLSLKQKAGGNKVIEDLQKEKLEKEIKKLDEQNAKLAWDREKESGKYLLKSDFEMELAARAAVLETSLRQMASTKAYEWIAICRGDYTKSADMAAMVTAEIGAVLNDYASTERFQVIFVEKQGSRGRVNEENTEVDIHKI
jgi:hypothetical protein